MEKLKMLGEKECDECGAINHCAKHKCRSCGLSLKEARGLDSTPEWLNSDFLARFKKEVDNIRNTPGVLRK